MVEAVALPAEPASFQKIKHIVVLSLENRAFDRLTGFMRANNPNIVGLAGKETNCQGTNNSLSPQTVTKATSFTMHFDPWHEFMNGQLQLYGPKNLPPDESSPTPNHPMNPTPMDGFLCSAIYKALLQTLAFSGITVLSEQSADKREVSYNLVQRGARP